MTKSTFSRLAAMIAAAAVIGFAVPAPTLTERRKGSWAAEREFQGARVKA